MTENIKRALAVLRFIIVVIAAVMVILRMAYHYGSTDSIIGFLVVIFVIDIILSQRKD